MKFAIVSLNIILVCFLVYAAAERFSNAKTSKTTIAVARRGTPKTGKNTPSVKPKVRETQETAPDAAVQAAVVSAGNIFDSARCENAQVFGRSNNKNSAKKVDLTLVGMIIAGDRTGAIILQKDKTLNSMQNQQTMMRPGMPPQPVSNTSSSTEKDVVYKQFIRLGETLANGYTLTSVTRTGAVLEKGSERLELAMTEASKNAPSASTSATQTMQGSPFQNMTEEQRREFRENMERARAERRAMRESQQNGGSPENANSDIGRRETGNNIASESSSGNSSRSGRSGRSGSSGRSGGSR